MKRRLPGVHLGLVLLAAAAGLGWGESTVRHVAWTAVDSFPPDLARQVRRHHKRFDAGIRRGMAAPPAWRAGPPGSLPIALEAQIRRCAADLREPVPLGDLVEELGVMAVLVLDANDPLAVVHEDDREAAYAGAYQAYVDSALDRLRLVHYGQQRELIDNGAVTDTIETALARSAALYPFVGQEFFRGGALRDWRSLDDRAVTFGVAGISLSRGLTDLSNFAAWVWRQGGGLVPTPRPTPKGHVGPTITRTLEGGFSERYTPRNGRPAMPNPQSGIKLPPP